ncbi:MAG: ketoacyl-ACP synthase III [Candidatus Omnitrophica bacterium]|nr:ketoacyl-ACP synthase III [Candidatus Omnitrophota bacterium]
MKARIQAIEYYLPRLCENGQALKKDNPDWRIDEIEQKTGISTRYISGPQETAVDMGVLAAEKLFSSGIKKEDIEFLIFITQSPDYVLPTSACILQDRLGLKKSCMAFDVNLGCSGYVYGLAMGGSLIEAGLVKQGLVICSETYTKYIDSADRTCRPVFSDGAAATVLTFSDKDWLGPFEMGTDGSGYCDLIVKNSGTRKDVVEQHPPALLMNGAKVFMFTMGTVPQCVESLLKKSGKTLQDIDLFIFHQASKLVIDNIVRRMEIDERKVYTNYQRIGNTVSASLPIALKDAWEEKRLKKGNQILLLGFGVGYSWGGCILKWEGNL